jgi:C4-dicarboxylate-specific signal transduction histidine kinase
MLLADEKEKAIMSLKEAQKKLIQSEKMASLGVLTACVAHGLNNPLNYIVGGYNAIHEHL